MQSFLSTYSSQGRPGPKHFRLLLLGPTSPIKSWIQYSNHDSLAYSAMEIVHATGCGHIRKNLMETAALYETTEGVPIRALLGNSDVQQDLFKQLVEGQVTWTEGEHYPVCLTITNFGAGVDAFADFNFEYVFRMFRNQCNDCSIANDPDWVARVLLGHLGLNYGGFRLGVDLLSPLAYYDEEHWRRSWPDVYEAPRYWFFDVWFFHPGSKGCEDVMVSAVAQTERGLPCVVLRDPSHGLSYPSMQDTSLESDVHVMVDLYKTFGETKKHEVVVNATALFESVVDRIVVTRKARGGLALPFLVRLYARRDYSFLDSRTAVGCWRGRMAAIAKTFTSTGEIPAASPAALVPAFLAPARPDGPLLLGDDALRYGSWGVQMA
ncbi:hypothetical protein LTR62_004235 [Meristemomyces frigidus]|uniref:Uncharacterized protein n=1 Tax=Meristemomyces frigidus TaxID=1508187 RepID=A0AAN7TFQ3_9PEZI|nr:hypothetical protein LTR62_004235 [Meristemomyces frigidus]